MADLPERREARKPTPVFDPALPASVTEQIAALADANPWLLAQSDESQRVMLSWTGGGRMLRKSSGAAVLGGALVVIPWLANVVGGLGEEDSHTRPGSIGELLQTAIDGVSAVGLLLAVGGGLCALLVIIQRVTESRRMEHMLRQARGRYVHPTSLTDDAAELLARAQQAAGTILRSRMHREDIADLREINNAQLPDVIWAIASSLQRYSQSLRASVTTTTEDPEILGLLDGERNVLATIRTSIADQVAALETYADKTREVDRNYDDRRALERLEARSEDVRDLLAGTAGAQVAKQDIEHLSTQAATVAESLSSVLADAKAAAAIALPAVD